MGPGVSDHDILITLVETVKNNHRNTSDKLEDVKNKIDEVKNGSNVQLANHEARISAMEALRDKVNPEQLGEVVKTHDKWINEFAITWKTSIRMAVATSSIISFILGTITALLVLFKNFFG